MIMGKSANPIIQLFFEMLDHRKTIKIPQMTASTPMDSKSRGGEIHYTILDGTP